MLGISWWKRHSTTVPLEIASLRMTHIQMFTECWYCQGTNSRVLWDGTHGAGFKVERKRKPPGRTRSGSRTSECRGGGEREPKQRLQRMPRPCKAKSHAPFMEERPHWEAAVRRGSKHEQEPRLNKSEGSRYMFPTHVIYIFQNLMDRQWNSKLYELRKWDQKILAWRK